MTRKLSIRLHESKKQEAESLFLPQSLKDEIGDFLPSCYTAQALAVFKDTENFDPEEEAEMYRNSGMAGVPSLRQLLKAMDERKEDMVSLAGAVSLAASKL